jgi:hypothetical protein
MVSTSSAMVAKLSSNGTGSLVLPVPSRVQLNGAVNLFDTSPAIEQENPQNA